MYVLMTSFLSSKLSNFSQLIVLVVCISHSFHCVKVFFTETDITGNHSSFPNLSFFSYFDVYHKDFMQSCFQHWTEARKTGQINFSVPVCHFLLNPII